MAQGNEHLPGHEHLIQRADDAIRRMHATAMKLREADLRSKGYVGHDTAQRIQYIQDTIQAKYDDIARYRAIDRGTRNRIYENERARRLAAKSQATKTQATKAPAKPASAPPSQAVKGAAKAGKFSKALGVAGKVLGRVGQVGTAYDMSKVGKSSMSRIDELTGTPRVMVKTPKGYANVPRHDADGNAYPNPQAAYLAARKNKLAIKHYHLKREAEKDLKKGG